MNNTIYHQIKGEWIKLEDSLPEDESDVLIIWIDDVHIAKYTRERFIFWATMLDREYSKRTVFADPGGIFPVEYWMYLPKQPISD